MRSKIQGLQARCAAEDLKTWPFESRIEGFPGMPFNQQMTIPCELTLRTTPVGVRRFAEPVAELSKLHGRKHAWSDLTLKPGDNPLADIHGDLFDINAEIEITGASIVMFRLRGIPIRYDVAKQEISCDKLKAPLVAPGGKLRLRICAGPWLDRDLRRRRPGGSLQSCATGVR